MILACKETENFYLLVEQSHFKIVRGVFDSMKFEIENTLDKEILFRRKFNLAVSVINFIQF